MKSRALISNGKGEYNIEEIDVAAPAHGEVRVKIVAAGLCHTDWDSIQHWNKTFIVGHEGAGIVDAVGPDVDNCMPGDKVILNWAIPCGKCFQCLEGNMHLCDVHSPVCSNCLDGHAHPEAALYQNNSIERSFHLGTLSEYTVVKAAAVVKIDSSIPFASASIISCGVMTGFGSAVKAAKVTQGSSVCVIGCGGVGLNVIQGARISGAAKIIAVDINPNRLEQAIVFGATDTVISLVNDVDFADLIKKIRALTQGRGADYAFECTAIPALGPAPLAVIRNAGTAVQVSGIEQRVEFDCELFEWDKKYINPLYGMCDPQTDFPKILSLYEEGKLMLDELVSKTYTLDTIADGFNDMLNGKLAKGVVLFEQG